MGQTHGQRRNTKRRQKNKDKDENKTKKQNHETAMSYDGSWQIRGLSTTTGRFDAPQVWQVETSLEAMLEPKRTESKVVNDVTVTMISPMQGESDTFGSSTDHEANVIEHCIIHERTSDDINVARQSCAPNSRVRQ